MWICPRYLFFCFRFNSVELQCTNPQSPPSNGMPIPSAQILFYVVTSAPRAADVRCRGARGICPVEYGIGKPLIAPMSSQTPDSNRRGNKPNFAPCISGIYHRSPAFKNISRAILRDGRSVGVEHPEWEHFPIGAAFSAITVYSP